MVLFDGRQGVAHAVEIGQIASVIWPVAFTFGANVNAYSQKSGLRQLAACGLADKAVAAGDHGDLHDSLPFGPFRRRLAHGRVARQTTMVSYRGSHASERRLSFTGWFVRRV